MESQTTESDRRKLTRDPLPDDLRGQLAALVAKHGESAVCQRAGLSNATLARALAGLGINRGTVAAVRAVLVKEREAEL